MASAQVLPNSAVSARKQEHLEAGKRRLEEFRKKKAADRAKKPSSASQLHSANVEEHEKQPLDNQIVRLTNSDGAGTSDGVYETIVEPSHVVINEESSRSDFVQNNNLDAHETNANPPVSINCHNEFSADKLREPAEDKEFDRYNSLLPQEKNDDFSISTSASGSHAYGIATDHSVASHHQVVWQTDGNSNHHSPYGLEQAHSKDSNSHVKNVTVTSPVTSHAIHTPTNSTDFSFEAGKSLHAVPEFNNSSTFDIGQKFSNSVGRFPSGSSIQLWPSESQYTALNSDLRSSSSDVPFYPAVAESNSRRSRPSFLDSINIARVPHTEPKRVELFSSKLHEMDGVASSAFEKSFTEPETIQPLSKLWAPTVPSVFEHSMNSSVSAGNGDDLYRHTVNESMEKHDSYSRKQDEDFSALEQHIEDLTQEKFSLQRALEASRALAESLATENSSLTESYNQQGSAVNQLKSDMENLQGEVKAHLVELHSLKMEYANAQLECNAADERAKLLASEVIGLEEKALRLRSSELKLERQLERSQAEVSSLKKKISSIEKDRQDLQSTIDALQEEKKLLQAKLRKASANGKFTDVSKSLSGKKDMSTSTGDLIHEDDTDGTTGSSNLEMYSTAPLLGSDASSSSLLPENRQLSLEVSSLDIPPDQMRMIQNIHTLISELKLEKQELMQAALAQSSECSHLKELNKELSRKFEAQTQRLELLTAQSMATENISARPEDPRSIQENTPYADEGDEVVERVLGWIMKLFPGGPSRRRTSKLL